MELLASILESAEDMTAAEIDPRPTKATHCGVKYLKTIGRIALPSGVNKVRLNPSTCDQSVALATTPTIADGTATARQPNIEATESVLTTAVLFILKIR